MLKQHIQEALQNIRAPKKSCSCGGNTCDDTSPKLALLESKTPISEGLRYHIENGISLQDNVFRMGSKKYLQLFAEARVLNEWNNISLDENSKFLIETTDIGKFGIFKGKKVPLDIPMLNEWNLEEAKDKHDVLSAIEKDIKRGYLQRFEVDEDEVYAAASKLDVRLKDGEADDILMMLDEPLREAKTFKKGDKIKYQLTFRGGVGKYADAISKSKEVKTGVIKKRMKTLSGFKYELTNGLEINPSEIIGLAESINEEREDYVVVDKRNLRPLMMNYGGGQFYEKWSTEEKAQADADELNRAYQKTYGAAEGPHVVMYKSDYYSEKRKQGELTEAEYQGRKVELGKPKRGGSKKFYVYVKDGDKVKKVSFGDTTGLKVKLKDKKARNAFSKRHDCPNKKDRTKASYWSCNLPRYAPALGLGPKMNTFW